MSLIMLIVTGIGLAILLFSMFGMLAAKLDSAAKVNAVKKTYAEILAELLNDQEVEMLRKRAKSLSEAINESGLSAEELAMIQEYRRKKEGEGPTIQVPPGTPGTTRRGPRAAP